MTRALLVRILVWLIVFLAPTISFGYPLPYGVFLLIPVLVVVDGLGTGRLLVWIGLTVLFELFFRVPLGMLSGPILVLAGIQSVLRRGIRLEARAFGISGPSLLARRLLLCGVWTAGMIVFSALMGWFVYDASLTISQMASIWNHLATGGLAAGTVLILFLLLQYFAFPVPQEPAW